MVLKADQVRVKALLAETITLLCKNGLHFKAKFSIQALIGITLDEEDIFLVNINETIESKDSALDESEDSSPFEQQPPLAGKRLRGAAARVTSGPSPGPASPGLKSHGGNSSIPKIHSNSHPRSTRITRQTSPHSVAATRSSEVSAGTRPAETSTAAGLYGSAGDSLAEQTSDSLPSANVGILDTGGTVTFPAVSIKNDSQSNDTSYDDSKPLPEESDLPEEPSSKRMRLRVSDVRPEPPVATPTSSEVNTNFASSVDATKSEPPDVIEIKEESYSDSESQLPNYSAYGDYNAAMYGGGNPDMSHAFGEASMFQAGSSFFVPQPGDSEQTPETFVSPDQDQTSQRFELLPLSSSYAPFATQTSASDADSVDRLAADADLIERNCSAARFPFKCVLCGKCITSKDGLRCHMVNWHNMPKNIRCEFCEETFGYRRALRRHIIACHPHAIVRTSLWTRADALPNL